MKLQLAARFDIGLRTVNEPELGAGTLSSGELAEAIKRVGLVDPQLRRILDGSEWVFADATLGHREWALLTMASLIAIGDAPNQLGVYLDLAVHSGATDDEILDVVNHAAVYVGAPRAVNAVRTITSYLAAERTRRLPSVKESVVRLADHDTLTWDNGGDGVPMLLIHALSLDHRFWREVYPQLSGAGRVIAYDLRGHGHARGAPLIESLEHLAGDAGLLLDRLGVEDADIYGASLGGAIAQHLAVNFPERVRSLALIATSSWAPTDALDARAESAEESGMAAQIPETLIRWFSPESIAENGGAVRYARECIRRDSVTEWAAAWRAMARLDVVARLSRIRVPAIAISGAQDLSAIPQAGRAMADAIPNCRFELIDPGTHMMPIEQPQALAAALLGFRTEVASRTA